MARIRSVKPEYWADEDLAGVTRDARLLYIGLWNLADEHGRLRGDPRYVKGQLFPYDDDLSPAGVEEFLKELEGASKVLRYRSDGGQYLFLKNLSKHQRLEAEKVPSKLPPPPIGDEGSEFSQVNGVENSVAQIRADKSARDSDESARGAEDHALLYVTGTMEHGACKPSARTPRSSKPAADGSDPDFDRFWAVYPRKVEKVDARKAWKAAVKKASVETLIDAARRYAEHKRGTETQFIAQPPTWLNKERWTDEEPTPDQRRANGNRNNAHQPFLNPDDPDTAYAGYDFHAKAGDDELA